MAGGECPTYPETPCRVNLDLMPHGDSILDPSGTAFWMYALTAVAFAIFAYGVWEMAKVWRMGRSWERGSWKAGLRRLGSRLARHDKIKREPREGTHHAWVFWGFVVLFIGTTIVAIDADIFELLLGSKLLKGNGYLVFEAALDLFGILFLVGLGALAWRRYAEKPGHLHRTRNPEAPPWLPRFSTDGYALSFLFLIGVTGFLLEGLRLQHQVQQDGITYDRWSFVGYVVAWGFEGWSLGRMEALYRIVWWTHFALWSSVLAILPWTKMRHILTGSLNVFFHDPQRQSRPELPTPFSLQKVLESGSTDLPQVGYATIRDLTWKDRLSLDACMNCGRCEAQCPATAAGRPLSPRKLIQDLKAEMWRDYRAQARGPRIATAAAEGVAAGHVGPVTAGIVLTGAAAGATASASPDARAAFDASASGGPRSPQHGGLRVLATGVEHAVATAPPRGALDQPDAPRPEGARPLASAEGIGAAIQEATLWSCTTCRACVSACPVDIEHVDIIAEMRRGLVMQSRLDEHQQKMLVNITNAGNPYGFPMADRADWRARLPPGVQVPLASEKGAGNFEWLWWVGCSGSFDPRNQQVTVAIATILNAAGVSFAVLGPEEKCTGDPARRLGEEGRFQQSAMENEAVLRQYGVAKVITQCPHCFNALGKEYPNLGAAPDKPPSPVEVVHHSELIDRLVRDGKLRFRQGKDLKVTYHDSCYLMRHNGIGEAPRSVLKQANNGLPVLEMASSRDKGLCCGAGGANMWYEVKDQKDRINVIRAKQAADTGADTVATACPFCLTMMKDGLDLTGQEGRMAARDLAEIVVENLDWTLPAPPAPAAQEAAMDGGSGGGWSG